MPLGYEELVLSNLTALRAADMVVACLDGADEDAATWFEAGYARALDKPVLAYRTDLRREHAQRVNTMLRHGCTEYLHMSALDEGASLERLVAGFAAELSAIRNQGEHG